MSDLIDLNQISSTDLQEHIAGLESVLEVTKGLAAEKDLDNLLDVIIQRACSALGCERASLFLYDEASQELYTRKVTQLEGPQEIRLPIDRGVAGLVARERCIELIENPYEHSEFNPEIDSLTGFRTRNILCAPLIAWGKEEKLLGVLQLLNKSQGAFEELDKQLLSAFAAHSAIAIDRAILAQHYKEKMHLMASLNLARQIQASLLPVELPEISSEYEIAAVSQPADATGGDYYDIMSLSSGNVGMVVADVSGHGFGPSLLMATARAMLRGVAGRDPAPEQLMTELSQSLYGDLRRVRRFITLMYGTLDPKQHVFRYANAGHGPLAVHFEAERGVFHSLVDDDARGFPLGWFDETFKPCTPVKLAPGDLLILGTDGVVETRSQGERFGMERLFELVLRCRHNPLQDILDELIESSIAFHETSFVDDDLTLMILRRR